jgi:hypothetical protein
MTVDMAQQASSMFKVDAAAKPRPRKHDGDFARHVRLDHGESEGMKTAQAPGRMTDEMVMNGAKAVFGAEQTVAERLRQATTVVENGAPSRVYPESLMVIGYLSMLGVAHRGDGRDGQDVERVRIPAIRPVGATDKPFVIADPLAAASPGPSPSPGLAAPTVVATYGVDASRSPDVVRQWAITGLPACPWQRQLMRITSNDDANTLWIRDYRISPADAWSSATRIASRLAGHGKAVDRIVLNGHVVIDRPAGNNAIQRNDNNVG